VPAANDLGGMWALVLVQFYSEGSFLMFDHFGAFVEKKIHRGYFQVEIMLDDEHESNKECEKREYDTGVFSKIGAAVSSAQEEGEKILKRVVGGRIVEGEPENDDNLPMLYVVDPSNRVIAGMMVKFIDYSNESIH